MNFGFKKFVSVVATIATLFNSIAAPSMALAQELTPEPTPTPTEEPTPAPTPEETIVPSESPTATPESTPEASSPTPEATVEPTPAVEETTPTPESQPEFQDQTNENAQSQGPPTEEVSATSTPSSEPTPTITPVQPEEEGSLTAEILETSLFSETLEENQWFKVITDKLDYAPTEAAVITGTGFTPGETYILTVSSTDEPATSTTVEVTTDSNGSFTYIYQLDGIYRPDYLVEVKEGETLLASTTFTDSHISSHECTNDLQGADDEPGQKDLTKMCVDDTALPTSINADWNWDDTGWNGANTGDACSLFDTDGNGLADFASCVTVINDPAVQSPSSPRIYTCNDTRADRCAGPTLVPGPYTSSCGVSITTDQPFITGDDTPNDTHAACTVQLSEVGGGPSTVAELIDVCSYPSQEPNSDPSDCIIFEPRTAKLEVIKDLIPSSDTGLFNLQIEGTSEAVNVGDTGTTGEKVLEVANNGTTFTVGEIAGTGTSLSSYSNAIECKNANGTGSVVAQSSDAGPLNVTLSSGDDVVCIITNTLLLGSLTVNKVLSPSDDPGLFNLQIDGSTAGTGADVGNGGTTGAVSLTAGTYTVGETAGTGTDLSDYTAVIGGDCDAAGSVTLAAGEDKVCSITNTRNTATITVNKNIDWNEDGDLDDEGDIEGTTAWTWDLTDGEQDISTGDSRTLNTGSYTITEDLLTDYHIVGWECSDQTNGSTNSIPVNLVSNGQNLVCTITNAPDLGSISGFKYVDADGSLASEDDQSPVEGLLVELWKLVNAVFEDTGLFDYTDETGYYEFLNIVPGTYQIREVLSSLTGDWISLSGESSSDIVVDPAESDENNNFVNFEVLPGLTTVKTLTSSNVAFVGDSVMFTIQVENTGNVTLYNPTISDTYDVDFLEYISSSPDTESSQSVPEADVSDYDGDGDLAELISTLTWDIGDLAPGDSYTLTLTFEAIQFTDDTPETTYTGNEAWTESCLVDTNECSQEDTITTDPSPAVVDIDALGSVTGNKFVDFNGDGQWGDEGTLGGVTINLYKWDGDIWVLQGFDITTGDGLYGFENLSTGDYKVCEEVPTGYAQTFPTDCHEFSITDNGEDIEDRDFGNQGRGTIIVEKEVEPDSDATFEFSIEGDLIETIGFELGDGDTTDPDYSNLPAGTYSITETSDELYTTTVECVSSLEDEETADAVELNPNEIVTCTFTNTRNTGTIIVHKIIDPDGNLEDDSDQFPGVGWEMGADGFGDATDFFTQFTGNDGSTTFSPANTGDYNVREINANQGGYDLVDYYCDNGVADDGIVFTSVGTDETVNCTFINTPNGTIHGRKWDDADGDGLMGEEDLLGGWKIFIDENENGTWQEGEPFEITDSDEELGWYSFDHLFPGIYTICEVPQDGWEQTSSPTCHTVELPEGPETLNTCDQPALQNSTFGPPCDFGNQELPPGILIEKSNDKSGGASVGDIVTYTLVVTNTGKAILSNIDVTDVLPGGFIYVISSTSINGVPFSDIGLTKTGTKLKWGNVGDLDGGEFLTLTYKATIASDLSDGTYTNFATCSGYTRREQLVECNTDDSSVTVGRGTSYGGNLQGQVLGISTELPATGSPTVLLIVSLSALGAGLMLNAISKKNGKSVKKGKSRKHGKK